MYIGLVVFREVIMYDKLNPIYVYSSCCYICGNEGLDFTFAEVSQRSLPLILAFPAVYGLCFNVISFKLLY